MYHLLACVFLDLLPCITENIIFRAALHTVKNLEGNRDLLQVSPSFETPALP